ncbi:MAG TPA: C40 family peptidase [Burkholderiales bacterium]|nr:C40 family peptidase [Burkholderiales bacterium]
MVMGEVFDGMTARRGAPPDRLALRVPVLLLIGLLAGCAAAPERAETPVARASDDTARKAVAYAREMIGKPYRYSGDTPAGFDCSGLVRYSFGRAGVALPRATPAQRKATTLISARSLRPGDLLFFDQEGKKASHVGIYLGDGRFVHAPSTGGRVRTDSLDADFWKKHFVEARRV